MVAARSSAARASDFAAPGPGEGAGRAQDQQGEGCQVHPAFDPGQDDAQVAHCRRRQHQEAQRHSAPQSRDHHRDQAAGKQQHRGGQDVGHDPDEGALGLASHAGGSAPEHGIE